MPMERLLCLSRRSRSFGPTDDAAPASASSSAGCRRRRGRTARSSRTARSATSSCSTTSSTWPSSRRRRTGSTAHVSVRGFVEFAVVFGMTLVRLDQRLAVRRAARPRGRPDAPARVPPDGHPRAAGGVHRGRRGRDGQPFALVYAAFLALMTWLWYIVRELDRTETARVPADHRVLRRRHGRRRPSSSRRSAFLPDEPRLVVWAAFAVALARRHLLRRRARAAIGSPRASSRPIRSSSASGSSRSSSSARSSSAS